MWLLNIIQGISLIYLLLSLIFWIFRRSFSRLSIHLSIFFLIFPIIWSIFTFLLGLIPYNRIYFLLNIIYTFAFTWKIISTFIFIWITLAGLCSKIPRLRMLFTDNRKLLRSLWFFLIFTAVYVNIFDFFIVEIGFCELPEPAEYLKNTENIPPSSNFWSAFISFLTSLILFVFSCIFCCFFYTPIKID